MIKNELTIKAFYKGKEVKIIQLQHSVATMYYIIINTNEIWSLLRKKCGTKE